MGLIKTIFSMMAAVTEPVHYISALDSSERLKRMVVGIVKKEGRTSILDIGMCEGELAEAILDECPEADYFGIDRERSVLKKASGRLGRFGPRVSLAAGDIEELSDVPALKGKKFGLIFLFEVLCFIEPGRPRRQAVLERVFRDLSGMLEKGGRVVIIDSDALRSNMPSGGFNALDLESLKLILSGMKLHIEQAGPLEEWAGETNKHIQCRFILIARKS